MTLILATQIVNDKIDWTPNLQPDLSGNPFYAT